MADDVQNDTLGSAGDAPVRGRIDRRQLLTGLAAAAGLTSLTGLTKSLSAAGAMQVPTSPSGVRLVTKRVLRREDLTYLGAMRVPTTADMMFSYGGLTGRKVGGEVRLLMVGNLNAGDPVYEFADTGTYHPSPSQAPRMNLVRAWGNIYGNARRTWRADGTEKVGYPRYPGGMYFSERTQLLYWTYSDTYNVSHEDDWSLGASRLAPTGPVAFGPWLVAGGGQKGSWRCLRVSEHPSGAFLCGTTLQSGNSSSPWGPDLWTGAFPTETTPAGLGSPNLPVTKYLTYYPMIGKINSLTGTFSGPIMSLRRPGDYVYEPFTGVATEIDPAKNGGIGSWTQLDGLGSPAWIDLPDVHGVIFPGRLASGHEWYRNAGGGSANCTHGLPSPVDITGPVSTDAYPALFLYDPADLDAVHAGKKTDYTVDPVAIINAQTTFGLTTAIIEQVGSSKNLGGSYFDPVARKLYICAPMADGTIPGLWNPLVHVFRIA